MYTALKLFLTMSHKQFGRQQYSKYPKRTYGYKLFEHCFVGFCHFSFCDRKKWKGKNLILEQVDEIILKRTTIFVLSRFLLFGSI